MECLTVNDDNNGNSFHPLPHSSPPAVTVVLPPSPIRDQCFSCKRQGHWAKDCPNKTPKKSSPSSPSNNSTIFESLSPPIRCPCGRGLCRLKTSKTEKNPDRNFYTCPVNCGFFKWCDELSGIIARAPLCPCGVGICSVNGVYTGPKEEKWYYACRIKKNHGACKFFQWANGESNIVVWQDGGETKVYSSLQSEFSATNVDLDTKEVSSDINVKSLHGSSSENTLDLPTITVHDQEQIPDMDLIMQEAESDDPVTQRDTQVFQPMAESQNDCLNEYWKLISVAGNVVSQAVIYQILGLHAYGWLGRLVFPPSQCPKDPPMVPVFCGVFPSFDPVSDDPESSKIEGPLPLLHSVTNAERDLPPSDTPGQDAQLSGAVFPGQLGLVDHSAALQDDNISFKLILKTFGRALFDTVESMNPLGPEQMLKVVKHTLIAFQKLSIECDAFMEGVMEYINKVSILASMEQSIQNVNTQEILERYEKEKVRFENVSYLHAEAEDAYRASNVRRKSLHDEISHVKGILVGLENQLVACQSKTTLLKARLDQVHDEVLEAKIDMDIGSRKMEEALELEQQRDAARDAARIALQTARTWLEEQ